MNSISRNKHFKSIFFIFTLILIQIFSLTVSYASPYTLPKSALQYEETSSGGFIGENYYSIKSDETSTTISKNNNSIFTGSEKFNLADNARVIDNQVVFGYTTQENKMYIVQVNSNEEITETFLGTGYILEVFACVNDPNTSIAIYKDNTSDTEYNIYKIQKGSSTYLGRGNIPFTNSIGSTSKWCYEVSDNNYIFTRGKNVCRIENGLFTHIEQMKYISEYPVSSSDGLKLFYYTSDEKLLKCRLFKKDGSIVELESIPVNSTDFNKKNSTLRILAKNNNSLLLSDVETTSSRVISALYSLDISTGNLEKVVKFSTVNEQISFSSSNLNKLFMRAYTGSSYKTGIYSTSLNFEGSSEPKLEKVEPPIINVSKTQAENREIGVEVSIN